MIVDDLNVFRSAIVPAEAHPVLVTDPDAVLAEPITSQGLKPVAGRPLEVHQTFGQLQMPESAPRAVMDRLEPSDPLSSRQTLGIPAREAADHSRIVTRRVNNV